MFSFQCVNRTILCSGKFLQRHRTAVIPATFSVGYSFSPSGNSVYMGLRNSDNETMEIRMMPEHAEEMAKCLIEWAERARKYQQGS